MKTIKTILALIIAINIAKLNAQELQLNTSKSAITWTGKAAFNAYSLTGTLEANKGTITIENDQILDLEIQIDMKSLDHDNSDLKRHLRSKDFFEVATYTKATFKMTKSAIIKDKKAVLIGHMTIKGITKEEMINISFCDNKLTFEQTMDRTQYGIKFNSPSFFKKMKENAIADNFILKGHFTFE